MAVASQPRTAATPKRPNSCKRPGSASYSAFGFGRDQPRYNARAGLTSAAGEGGSSAARSQAYKPQSSTGAHWPSSRRMTPGKPKPAGNGAR